MFAIRRFTQRFVSFIVILTVLFSGFDAPSAHAQGRGGIKREINADSGKVSFIGPASGRSVAASEALGILPGRPGPPDPAQALVNRYAPEFGLTNPGRDLARTKSHRLDNGRITARYQQKYQGIPVLAGELIVNTNDNGDLYSISGEVSPELSLQTWAVIEGKEARQMALEAIQKWYSLNAADLQVSEPELWIFDESLLTPSARPPELVWRMEVTAADSNVPVCELILINAQTGNLSMHFNQIDTAWKKSGTADGIFAPPETPIMPSRDVREMQQPIIAVMPTTHPPQVTANQLSSNEIALLATTWYVATTGNDSNSCTATGSPCATINGAIAKAAAGDIINVAIGTYTGSGNEIVLINKNITLLGGWDATFTTQSGMSTIDVQFIFSHRCITISNGITASLDHLIIQHGRHVSDNGAGIYNDGGILTLSNSTINDNLAPVGGGIYNNGGSVALNNSTVTNNSSNLDGGGIYNNGGTLTINNGTINNNTYARNGGGIYNNAGTVNLTDSTVSNNGVFDDGGGIYNDGGTTNIVNSIISNNTQNNLNAPSGQAEQMGGGILSKNGTLTITNSTISGNTAKDANGFGFGGGIRSSNTSLTITQSELNENTAAISGGGIYLVNGSLTLNNSTMANNTAYYGGGIYRIEAAMTLNNVTIANNNAYIGGGFYSNSPSFALSMRNSIVANNTAAVGTDCSGPINTSKRNIIGNTTGCSVTAGVGDQFNINPLIGTYLLGSPAYLALQTGSPAINSGDSATCLSTDQRGKNRIGVCDIGAYEYELISSPGAAASFGYVGGNNQRVAPSTSFGKPLAVYVFDSNGDPVPGITVTFTAPAAGASGTFLDSGARITTAVTDNSGVAMASPFTANSILGNYNVNATTASLPGTIMFSLTNVTWFVAPTGNDANTCASAGAPCLTIKGAVNKATAGDTILVAIGTYTNASDPQVVEITKSISLSGGWNNTFTTRNSVSTIDGQNARTGLMVDGLSTVSLDHFILQNGKNSAPGYGGGINVNKGVLTLNNTAVNNNVASAWGGGIFSNGMVIANNTTISGNTATNYGGGGVLANGPYGAAIIQNSTIANNTSGSNATPSGGGLQSDTGATVILRNSILAKNQSLNDSGPDCAGTIDISDHNIIGNTAGCTISSGSGNKLNIDPLITVNLAPFLGGPAVDAGNPATCLSTDKRGVVRPQGAVCDIGAFEQSASDLPATVTAYGGSGQSAPIYDNFTAPLQARVLDSLGQPVGNAMVTFSAPISGASGSFPGSGTTTIAATNENGIAAVSFKANLIAGGYMVTATVSGVGTPANFSLTNSNAVSPLSVLTYTANNGTSLPGSLLCNQSQPTCTNGVDPQADIAHTYALGTYDLYMTQYGRDSLDNAGMSITSTVHYSSGYDNAYWDGSQMVYGDGYGFANADDIVAHELTHGVTQYESNLLYFYQSGAINESFSDLWGEYFDQTNGQGNDTPAVKWLIGEDVSDLGAFRSMSDPPVFGDPDKITSTLFYKGEADNGGIHHNSGVNNKAIFLMVDGGVFNGKTVSGIGWDKTAAIYYEAQTNLLGSGSNYSDLYYALQQACSTLTGGPLGITLENCINVKNALDAVQMNSPIALKHQITAPLCPTGMVPSTTLFEDKLEGAITDNWNASSSRWSLRTDIANSPTHSIYGDDFSTFLDETVAMKTGVLIGPNTYLHFSHAYDFDYFSSHYFDGGVLEYSINGGSTWTDAATLFSAGVNYGGNMVSGFGNVLGGRKGFVGSTFSYYSYYYIPPNFVPSLVSSRFNLSSLAGQTVKVRFRFATDESVAYGGWYIDDVQIYTCLGTPVIPVLQSPLNNFLTTDYTPLLDWADSTPPVDRYEIQVSTSSTFASTLYDDTNVLVSQYTVPADLTANATYYWRVRAFNSEDATNDWSLVRSFRTVMLPPILSAPANASSPMTPRPTFTWTNPNSGPAPTNYTVQIAKDAGFTQMANTGTVTTTSYTPIVNLANPPTNQLFWRVKANGTNGPSANSAVFSFIVPVTAPPAPTLVSPATNALTTNYQPVFTWSAGILPSPTTVDHFQIQIDDDASFGSTAVDTTVGVATFTPGAPLASNKIFYWRVRTHNNLGEISPWSAVRTVKTTISPPTLSSPADTANVLELRPTFDWTDVPGATGYTIQIAKDAGFTQIAHTGNPTTSQYSPTVDLPKNTGTPLFWRVQTKGAIGPSAFTASRSFNTPVNPPSLPTLTSPASNALTTDLTPTFVWTMPATSPAFDHFFIQVDNNVDFSSPEVNISNASITTLNFTPGSNLLSNTKFYWRVRAVNVGGEQGNWSASKYFRTALDAPTLSSPANGATVLELRPTFDWTDVAGATGYTIQIAKDAGFTQVVNTSNPTGSQYTPIVDLPKNTGTPLFWRVQTKGTNGPGAYTASRSFNTPVNPPGTPALSSPANNFLTSDYSPALSWTMPLAIPPVDHFIVQVDNNLDFSSPEEEDLAVVSSPFSPSPDLASGMNFYWRVRAVNASGELSNWSAVRSLRTLLRPPVLLVPANTMTIFNPSPVFNWDDVPGATGYVIQVSPTSNFATLLINARTVSSFYETLFNLPTNMVLYWRVQATGPNGPSTSQIATFVTQPLP
jgi:Zn-dependent metalloprotease